MTGFGRYDLLNAWSMYRVQMGVEPRVIDDIANDDYILFGGLDLAERIDSSVLFITKWDGTSLTEYAMASWKKMKTPVIANQVRRIQEKHPMQTIGFDETGAGIVASSFFYDLDMEPVQLTQNRKDDAVNCVRFLFQSNILRVQNPQLITELMEQEKITGKGTGRPHYRHQNGRHDDAFWACAINCYIAVPYIVGIPPAVIETTQDIQSDDIDTIIRDILKPYSHSAYGYTWG